MERRGPSGNIRSGKAGITVTDNGHSAAAGNRPGFTVVELMAALVAVTLLANLIYPTVRSLIELRRDLKVDYQDEIGIYQLQITLAVNDITKVTPDSITYRSADSNCIIRILNGKLISQPGTVDYIHGIDDCYFEVIDDIVYLSFTRNRRECWPIAYYSP